MSTKIVYDALDNILYKGYKIKVTPEDAFNPESRQVYVSFNPNKKNFPTIALDLTLEEAKESITREIIKNLRKG